MLFVGKNKIFFQVTVRGARVDGVSQLAGDKEPQQNHSRSSVNSCVTKQLLSESTEAHGLVSCFSIVKPSFKQPGKRQRNKGLWRQVAA